VVFSAVTTNPPHLPLTFALRIPSVNWQVYHLDPETLQPVGPRNGIGFSGVFLTDEQALAREKARRAHRQEERARVAAAQAAAERAATERELELLELDLDQGQLEQQWQQTPQFQPFFVSSSSVSWGANNSKTAPFEAHEADACDTLAAAAAAAAAYAAAAATPKLSAAQCRQQHQIANDVARAKAKKAASRRQLAMMRAAETGGPCTADLDAALLELHAKEYDLDGVVEGMRIADYVRPETLEAEATKLGLQPDAQHPGRFRSPPNCVRESA